MEVKAAFGVYRKGVIYQLGILVYIRHKSVRCSVLFEPGRSRNSSWSPLVYATNLSGLITITTGIALMAGLINKTITNTQVRVSVTVSVLYTLTNYKPTSHAGAFMSVRSKCVGGGCNTILVDYGKLGSCC
jgi:hypothetical protein